MRLTETQMEQLWDIITDIDSHQTDEGEAEAIQRIGAVFGFTSTIEEILEWLRR